MHTHVHTQVRVRTYVHMVLFDHKDAFEDLPIDSHQGPKSGKRGERFGWILRESFLDILICRNYKDKEISILAIFW